METNRTMMQFFEWYLPNDGFWWKRCAAKAQNLAELGITDIWLPPAYKCTSQDDVGYSIYDLYDLGEFDQKGTVRTKYGTKEEYIEAVQALHNEGMLVYADIVLNHRMGGDKLEKVRAVPVSPENRYQPVGDEQTVSVWSEFTFPGRNNKYSTSNGITPISQVQTGMNRQKNPERFIDSQARTGNRIPILNTAVLTILWE